MSAPVFRVATPGEVETMLDWAAAEGWNPGLEDAAAFRAADPGGFFVATVDEAPVAAISVVNHSPRFAFLGLYLCREEFRGRGIGLALWTHALDHAGDRTVGLDGVAAQERNYAKSGFVAHGRTIRFEGRFATEALELPEASVAVLPRIAELDRAANGIDRPRFLAHWIGATETRRTVMSGQGGRIEGFATARRCGRGCKVGPVVAPSVAEALHLARQAAAALGCQEITLDLPESQSDLADALRQLGFVETFATMRMYRGPAPAIGETCRAVASMELG